ncbi:hypothetical protein [Maribacter sp. 4G9]|uniref:hypothetical protein n=1 Tax=Maribacter sp. 4G9 TaxID=1889777 RepID=UPI000C14F538|nr:hypothetical protein [Maribacter sp. 4G9]PIB26433.1 hypothetical protein BFP75_08285 [Maribacter sp. 4G9]
MKLNIPKDKAIEILEKRKSEIYRPDFEPSVWKGTVDEDLKAIFGYLDSRWLKISQIRFDTYIESDKIKVFETGRKQASGFMDTFIEQIKEYSKIQEENIIKSETVYKQKYKECQQEVNQLMNQLDEAITIANDNFDELKKQDSEIASLKKNTVQLQDITIIKLFKLLGNLPVKQIVGLISIIIGILAFAGWCGSQIEKSTNRTITVDYKEEIQQLKKDNSNLNDSIVSLNKILLEKEKVLKTVIKKDSLK